jgi:hypothetical protein
MTPLNLIGVMIDVNLIVVLDALTPSHDRYKSPTGVDDGVFFGVSNYDECKTINGRVTPLEVIGIITTKYYLF